MEEVTPPQAGPPLHIHEKEDEVFYILEGECELRCGDQTIRAPKGALAVVPHGMAHTFKNIGSSPSKVPVTILPGGFEKFFHAVDAAGEITPAQVAEIGKRHGLTILPPGS
jgi:uncharacterized cupin superfamily protein